MLERAIVFDFDLSIAIGPGNRSVSNLLRCLMCVGAWLPVILCIIVTDLYKAKCHISNKKSLAL